jgi:hypothetical protein
MPQRVYRQGKEVYFTCGSGRTARMSIKKYDDRYLLAIAQVSSTKTPLPNTRDEGAMNPVRN